MNLILIVLGLMMIVEGIPCFGFPDHLRELARKLQDLDDSVLRGIGLAMIAGGLVLVYLGKVAFGQD